MRSHVAAAEELAPFLRGFTLVIVHATVAGADPKAQSAYRRAAIEARGRRPVARSIRGNVAYKLGEVLLTEQSEPAA